MSFAPRLAVLLALAAAGCAGSSRDRAWLDEELRARMGAATSGDDASPLPPGVSSSDGLDEQEVLATALWRSPSLRVELTRIDAARPTLDEAGRPANPQLSVMGPIGPVTAVATLLVPIESLWQIPQRTEAAARDADVAGESVLMAALDLVRDVLVLHAELGLAQDRAAARAELAEVSAEMARIGHVRAEVGDTSPLDAAVPAADARTALAAADTARSEILAARARLIARLALDDDDDVRAVFTRGELEGLPPIASLVEVARTSRPDVWSAEHAIEAAAARAGGERARPFNVAALVEGQWSDAIGPSLRLGGRIDLPIFGANPGGVGRAEAEITRAMAQLDVVARAVVMDIWVAHTRLEQAARSRVAFEEDVLPSLEEGLRVATSAYEEGEETYLVVLDVLRRLGDARLRHAELIAESRRARAELERAIGARLDGPAP